MSTRAVDRSLLSTRERRESGSRSADGHRRTKQGIITHRMTAPEELDAATGRVRLAGQRLLTKAMMPIRFFSSASDAPRARRPTDFVLCVGSIGAIVTTAALAPDPEDASATADFIKSLPGLFGWFWEIVHVLAIAWAMALLIAALFGRGRRSLFRDQVLALILAALGSLLLAEDVATAIDGLTPWNPPPIFPAVAVALIAAVSVTSSPHLGRPARRTGRLLVAGSFLAAIALGGTSPMGAIAIGAAAATIVHLIFGSPGGRPTVQQVSAALADLGFDIVEVEPAWLQTRGVAVMRATTASGGTLLVKIYGRDAWDGQLLSTIWTFLWYRDEAPTLTFSRLQQVEHEAFVTLLAERAAVPVLPVVAAGSVANDALLVVETEGEPLSGITDASDAMIGDLWRGVERMHRADIAHRTLDAERLFVRPDRTLVIGDFGRATSLATEADVHADRAQLLVTTALALGTDRAVTVAADALEEGALAGLLPFLQEAALSRASRSAVDAADLDLDSLREAAASAAATDVPDLVALRRVTWGTLLQIALIGIAGWVVISSVAGIGLDTIVDELSTADWSWLLFALVIAPLVQVFGAFSTIGAALMPLRYGPVLQLQFAIQFIALAVPSSAARIAVSIRFFQRAGAPTATAVAIGAIDSVSGFLIQAMILAIIALGNLVTLDLSLNGSDITFSGKIIAIGAIVLLLSIVIAVFIPRFRRMIAPHLSEARESARVLREPVKLLQLFGGNFAAQVMLAVVLGLCLRAFGESSTLAALLLVNTMTSLFSGVMPVPGGIGVTEAAMTTLLIGVGIPQSPAIAATLAYRIITFYLPPVWGVLSMRALKRNGQL
jgi:uncharacterized membrane protein YbhN (UPF0104 family)/tRNA A-37 threonylcarbamoyl transferase component Bud32